MQVLSSQRNNNKGDEASGGSSSGAEYAGEDRLSSETAEPGPESPQDEHPALRGIQPGTPSSTETTASATPANGSQLSPTNGIGNGPATGGAVVGVGGRKRPLLAGGLRTSMTPTKRTVMSLLARARAAQAKQLPSTFQRGTPEMKSPPQFFSFKKKIHTESKKIGDYIIKSRSESFCASPEIEDRDEIEVGEWATHKKTHFYFSKKKKLFHSLGLVYKSMKGMMTNSIDRDQWLNRSGIEGFGPKFDDPTVAEVGHYQSLPLRSVTLIIIRFLSTSKFPPARALLSLRSRRNPFGILFTIFKQDKRCITAIAGRCFVLERSVHACHMFDSWRFDHQDLRHAVPTPGKPESGGARRQVEGQEREGQSESDAATQGHGKVLEGDGDEVQAGN
ncbi:hypothetical protein GEV33_009500 [Tenebrio molitor]|uniref:Uncharacterized protein n=1 Tax=Tenebrio molitor TaxID=7067 RepID=A0A8J6LH85_TENMO|nr:hypothetical protein GEV33_009500 [Tenebrio molitor]